MGLSTPSTPPSHSQPGFAHCAHPGRQRRLMGIVFAKLRGFLAQVHWLPSLCSHENTADSHVPHVEERLYLPSPGACLSPSSTARAETDCLAQQLPSRWLKTDKGNPGNIGPALWRGESIQPSMAFLQSLSPWAWPPPGCPLISLASLPTQGLGRTGSGPHASITGEGHPRGHHWVEQAQGCGYLSRNRFWAKVVSAGAFC